MSLLSVEIAELRKMNQDVIAGNIKATEVKQRLKIYKEVGNREKMVLDILKLSLVRGMSFAKIEKFGLLTQGEILPVQYEIEQVYCPSLCKPITKNECLDYSGDIVNYEDCHTCEHFGPVRKQMCGTGGL